RPAAIELRARPRTVEGRAPSHDVRHGIPRRRVCPVVVPQRPDDDPVEMAQLQTAVVSGPSVDPPEGLDACARLIPQPTDAVEKRCLAVVENETAGGKGGAGKLI